MIIAKVPCSKVGCSRIVDKKVRYCEEHEHIKNQWKRDYDATRPSSHKRGYNSTWRKIRDVKLKLNPLCESCGVQASEVDHIISLRSGGDNQLSNLQSLCKPCHSRKTIAKDGGFSY